MELNDFQEKAMETAVYPFPGENLPYAALGLAGEAGECANIVKKVLRDEDGVPSQSKRDDLIEELGDTLWYAAAVARELGTTLEDAAQGCLDKLRARKEAQELHGR